MEEHMLTMLLRPVLHLRKSIQLYRRKRKWRFYHKLGMQLGKDIVLPESTWIDYSHCFLISIGDRCGFGSDCAILAHDAMSNEYLDATKIGRVKIHESCYFGMRTVILPGVEIGPRSIVGSNSVVATDIPPETVAAGNPARVICSLETYLKKQRKRMEKAPLFPYKQYSIEYLKPGLKKEMIDKLDETIGYITGGYSAMKEDPKITLRT
jgi:maltose O-acetyltransferase